MDQPVSGVLAPVAASPHAKEGAGVAGVMFKVQLTLLPATLCGFWVFGWPALGLWALTVCGAVAGEAVCLRLMGRAVGATLADGSAVLCGWLLALSLPPWAPWWLGVIGGLFATVIGKQVFGGLGCNLFNPAMVARVALLVSFPAAMTLWVGAGDAWSGPGPAQSLTILGGQVPDAYTSATLLGHAKTELARGASLLQTFTQGVPVAWSGQRAGSLGETGVLLIAAGGLALIALRVIRWHIPFAMLAGIVLPALVAHGLDPARFLDAGTHLMNGAAVLGAFFIATDYVTSPSSRAGQLLFGAGCGLLTWLIRTYGGYPEGVAFAVLLMNAFTPAIERLLPPRIYGRDHKGRPLLPPKEPTA